MTGESAFPSRLRSWTGERCGRAKDGKSLGNGIDPLEIIDQYGAGCTALYVGNGHKPGKRSAL